MQLIELPISKIRYIRFMNSIVLIAQVITLLFGMFFIGCGCLMLIVPTRARNIIRKAGSTKLINYGEITVRMIPAAAMVIAAEASKFPEPFKIMGWFMLGTSLVLFFIPPKLHNAFANKGADRLSPLMLRLIAPLALGIGGLIIYNAS
jgi:hypothetical protein